MGRSWMLGALLVLCSGCLLDLEDKPPPVPEGYPRLGEYEDGKADLLIDGEEYVSESGGGTDYNVEGGFEDQLRVSTSFDYKLDLNYRDVEVGVYKVANGDLVADYGLYVADPQCGDGNLEIVGRKRYDAGLSGEREFIWGTIQLELCDEYPSEGEASTVEVSGRFTSIVSRS